MTRIVEIDPDALAQVRRDVASTRDAVEDLGSFRWRMSNLGVPTGALHEALASSSRLGSNVLPVLDTHVRRAQDLAALRYGGAFGAAIPVVDDFPDVFTPPSPFTQTGLSDGSTLLTWTAAPGEEQEADKKETEKSRGIGGWFSDRWDDVSDAVSDGADWVADTAADAWDEVTDAGAAIADWWESVTADLGGWIDENLADLREFIGKHVGVFRFLASACRVIGWVVVAIGAVLTIALTIIGAMGGAGIGAVFGFGVGAVPAGGAGAAAGASFGLKILGVGFALVSVGDFLDVAADWGEGKIDGQDLVKQGSLELVFAITSLAGAGVIGKIGQKVIKHLPASWRRPLDDFIRGLFTKHRDPLDEPQRLDPLRNGNPSGTGWTRGSDYGPDPQYGLPRTPSSPLNADNPLPSTLGDGLEGVGGSLDDLWGTNPATGKPFTQSEWMDRFSDGGGDIRWPPNGGAVPGSRVLYSDPEEFVSVYGNQLDRVGGEGGGFLGIPPDVPFAQRSLPPTTLDDPLHQYAFTGKLPSGVTIEVSEIAPAFGRPGGGIQVRFMEGTKSLTVKQLRELGVLR
ncbi:TNT domain-containing protein [Cellulomonas sp. URHE0023]|uniref:TNT domain-containing protein n=1 Tax=Cellulomonas sp. URHE0023 TaxID=1380354 RepID=UPI000487901D|nr:TNT domain-containing protein [Cellulomonas sp. URHE0023]